MEKHFCDRCEQEIKEDGEFVFGKELCKDCCERIEYFIENPDAIICNSKDTEDDEYVYLEEATVIKSNEAIQGIKIYTEEKDPCEGCTCFEAFSREDYRMCPKLIHALDEVNIQHKFYCNEKNVAISFRVDDFINNCKTITPRDFEEVEDE